MSDPYKVLGISSSATDEEVKKAYRKMAKKYHPDNFSNSPMREQAEEKMKEINEAYDMIQKMRASGSSYQSGNGYSGGGYYSGYRTNTSGSGIYYTVRMHINSRQFTQAEILLNSVQTEQRTGEWYFLNGIIMMNRGWYYEAENSFITACDMEPQNEEYRAAYNYLKNNANNASGSYRTSTTAMGCSCCDLCTAMMCLDCLCSCCCGGH